MQQVVAAPPSTTAVRCINGVVRGCLALITFIYLAAVCNVIVPRHGYSVHGAGNLLALTSLTGLAVACYLQCVFCDAGKAPRGWQPDTEHQAAVAVQQVKRSGGGMRFCKKCQTYKPPRAHHCKRCGQCVLRMDHHCVWVNNCIGHGNYRAFALMTFYLTAACLHALLLLLSMDAHLVQIALGWDEDSRLLAAAGAAGSRGAAEAAEAAATAAAASTSSKTGWKGPFWIHALVQVVATAVTLPVSVGLVVLLVWNAYLFLRNQTTIEYHEGVVAQYLSGAGSPSSSGGGGGGRHPFDLGWHDNMHAVCGGSPACWPLPGRAAAEGDGLSFPTPWGQRGKL